MRNLLSALLLGASALLGPASVAQPDGPAQVLVPVRVQRTSLDMVVHYYKPEGTGPFPAVVYLHGRAPNRSARHAMESAVPPAHAEWWLRRGVAVIAPVRPGYGATGGADFEDTGARWRGGECVGEPDFLRVARAAAQSAMAAYDWAQWQPWIDRDRMLVEGYSLGGLAATALAAENPRGLRGVVNFSGGTAGNPAGSPGHSCRPDRLATAWAELGRSARVPSLWFYAVNDRYWGAQAPKAWYAAYAADRRLSALVVTPPSGEDGHHLLMQAPQLWSHRLEAFAREAGVLRHNEPATK